MNTRLSVLQAEVQDRSRSVITRKSDENGNFHILATPIPSHLRWPRHTGGLQGVTAGYSGLQRVTRGYKGLERVTEGYNGLEGIRRG